MGMCCWPGPGGVWGGGEGRVRKPDTKKETFLTRRLSLALVWRPGLCGMTADTTGWPCLELMVGQGWRGEC